MNGTGFSEMQAYLEEQAAARKRNNAALSADGRQDEAVFARIEMNVFEIFAAVLSAAAKTGGGEAFFLERLEQIPGSWRAALAKAEAHGDAERAHIERVKLGVAGEIRQAFDRFMEVEA